LCEHRYKLRKKNYTLILVAEFYSLGHKMGSKKNLAVNFLSGWLSKRSLKVKIFLGILLAFCALVVLKHTITEPDFFYIASGSIHVAGLAILVYKLFVYKTCSGMFLSFSSSITAVNFCRIHTLNKTYCLDQMIQI
jgi:hypothetical protein